MADPQRGPHAPHDEPRGDHAALWLLIVVVILLVLGVIAVLMSAP